MPFGLHPDPPATETRRSSVAAVHGLVPTLEVPALTVAGHPEARRVGELVTLPELASGRAIALSRLEPAFAPPGSGAVAALGDSHLSRRPLLLTPGERPGEVQVERAGSPMAAGIDGEPLSERRLVSAEELARGVALELAGRIVLVLHRHPAVPPSPPSFGLIGDSAAMLRLRQEIRLAARVDSPALLRGESGAGKELVARALFTEGLRRSGPYVTVNMAAIPPALAAAELFGAAKGAYTGAAASKAGFFQRAHGGTLFLDEIGETPPEVQPLLLRALESGEIQPVGSAETRRVDVRLVAATDADLEALVRDGRFRAPLLHRLAGFEIRVPALAERRSDVGRLLYAFLARELAALGSPEDDLAWLPAGLVARLVRFSWPGNVRQLRFAAHRLAAARQAGTPPAELTAVLGSLLAEPPAGAASTPAAAEPSGPLPTPPAGRWRPAYRKRSEIGEEELLAALRAHRFELKPAAAALGLPRTVLYELIETHPGVRKAGELAQDEIAAALAKAGGDVEAAALALEVSAQGLKRRLKALGLT